MTSMRHAAFAGELSRDDLLTWFRTARARTRQLFELFDDDAYYERPIALRNPLVFYEGHLPAFTINTLVKLAFVQPGIDVEFETLFARGIDPDSEAAVQNPTSVWPSRDDVQAYGRKADELVEQLFRTATLEDDSVPALRRGEAVLTILEHELMHQETLLYMLHNLPHAQKCASRWSDSPELPQRHAISRTPAAVLIPEGKATLGGDREQFGWDNEFAQHVVDVPKFEIDVHNVTNGDYLQFMNATGAGAPHFWRREGNAWMYRGMFALEPLPLDHPVYVTHEEAVAYAEWKKRRLPTEAEFHRAAYGTRSGEERLHPWGDEPADATRGNFGFQSLGPVAIGSYPAGVSAWGVHDLVGNGWEWTSTIFAPFEGFEAMPSYSLYSSDFFDGAHFVMKGASPVTGRELVRRSFRNWFRPNYPYVYATFRTAR
jgi:iron(II)-dependent oxidoreductase